ncbi:hypothetical protein BTHERMOSOX_1410 [Bathymodiolus thermophilus thioautotrophic gill symbiont]|nr:hypothetical protein BTHERMOSOX_1410 [Bathymodiolus thermophilus thioautotrophic gill symbiont]
MIFLNLILAGLKLGLKNCQFGESGFLTIIHIDAKSSM